MLLELEIEGDYRNSTGSVIFPLDRHSTTRSLMSGLRVASVPHKHQLCLLYSGLAVFD
jgi:hypothetical protein